MTWHLLWTQRAQKDLDRLDAAMRARVVSAIDQLITDPGRGDLRKLTDRQNQWRLRIGNYRAILEMDSRAGEIRVLRISDRKDTYR